MLESELRLNDWLPASCFTVLNAVAGAYTGVLDTGSFCTIAEHLWLASPSRRMYGSSNGRFMGGSLPTAIGCAASDGSRPVFCVTGDGGMRMYVSEFRLAIARRLPLCLILMSDGRYASIAAADPERKLTRAAIDVPGPSWLRCVEAFGCHAVLAQRPEDFASAVNGWNKRDPIFIECRFAVEPYANMTQSLR
jgi:acetolactate synthase-1/2/3 large subunit